MRKHMKVNQRAFNTRCEFDNFALLKRLRTCKAVLENVCLGALHHWFYRIVAFLPPLKASLKITQGEASTNRRMRDDHVFLCDI
jgi:hypothetical protein